MHRVLVDSRRWLSEERFLHALNYCMLLPGPEAQQLSVYIGWLMHGTRGGLLAGLLFILPGFVAVLALSVLYTSYRDATIIEALFYGLKPAVLAIVLAAVVRLARRSMRDPVLLGIAAAAFIALFFLAVPFPLVIGAAGAAGLVRSRMARPVPATVAAPGAGGAVPPAVATKAAVPPAVGGAVPPAAGAVAAVPPAVATDGIAAIDGVVQPAAPREEARPPAEVPTQSERTRLEGRASAPGRPSHRRALGVLAVGMTVWLAPVALLVVLLGPSDIYASLAVFFSAAAVVTFGGAYAVLAFVAQQAVEGFGWLSPAEMLDGLAMAETTPGPLIMVVEFVGYLAAHRGATGLDALLAGVGGAVLVTWVTFVPSFLWVFLGAPYAEHLRGDRRLSGALSAITAAVVGAILNLALWFALHVLFARVDEVGLGPFQLSVPDPTTLDLGALAVAIGASLAVFRSRTPLLVTLGISALAGAAWYSIAGLGS